MSPLLAHGLGDAGDLPVELPVVLFLVAGAVLAAAALADRAAPPGDVGSGRPLPRLTALVDAPATRTLLRALGVLGLAIVLVTAALGPASAATNPAPRVVFTLFWGTLVPLSFLLGPFWRRVNPLRTLAGGLARIAGDPASRTAAPLPAGIGVWPAAAQLALFVWAERTLALSAGSVLLVVLALVVVQLLAALRWGPAWFRHGDPFEVVSEVVAAASPLGRGDDGCIHLRPVRRSARRLRSEAGVGVVIGLVVAAHLGDFVLDSPVLHGWRATLGAGGQVGLDTLVLAAVAAAVVLAGRTATRRGPWLAAALVPVAVGYAVAHDLGVLLVEGQFAFIQLSDPLGRGWDLLGMSGRFVPLEPIPPGLAAALVVVALVAGHVGGVIVGRDLARLRYEPRAAAAVQLGLRTLLVVSAVLGVWLRLSVA